jgi:hypothetical protein
MISRLTRLRRMKKVLKEKSSEAFRRSMQELDKEDNILSRETEFVQSDLSSILGGSVDDFD